MRPASERRSLHSCAPYLKSLEISSSDPKQGRAKGNDLPVHCGDSNVAQAAVNRATYIISRQCCISLGDERKKMLITESLTS